MRLAIIHDRDGNIASVVAYPTDAPPAYPEMRPGQRVLDVDAPSDLKGERDPQKRNERLLALMENYRVDVSAQGRLTQI
jgi:hypothetical protein